MRFFHSIYRLLLNLYPRDFRDEFRAELQAVFDLSLQDATKKGSLDAIRVVAWELACLPQAIVHEYFRERRRTTLGGKNSSHFEFVPYSRSEALAALAPLLLTITLTSGISLLFSTIGRPPGWLVNVPAYLLLGLFFGLLLVGLVKGFPRWTMPYLGLLLAFYSVYGFSEFIYQHYGIYHWSERSWFLGELDSQIYLWSGLTVVVILLIMASAILPPFRMFRRDWTLLSFLVYGVAPFAVLLAFDEYQYKDPYQLTVYFILALGVWFYLHTGGKWRRFLVLFSALTLSMWMVPVSKMILLPSQTWFHGQGLDWGNEMIGPISMWAWLSLTILVPSVISLFPRVRRPAMAA